jgi:predicted dehydrogenase
MTDIRIGIVGCGAVTTKSHLPALQAIPGVRVVALADPQTDRTSKIATCFGVPKVVGDYRELLDDVDALILALPHHLHAPIGAEILLVGKHVLMEKPLANTVIECDHLIAAAAQGNAVLAVGQVRRFMTAYKAAKQWIASGILGEVTGFDIEEGGVYNWPVASDFFFRPEMSGGGVLMDTGAHVLDALLWWLGDLEPTAYEDDNAGGVEADCTLRLRSITGVEGSLTLSRVRGLRNTCVIRGVKAEVEVALLANQARLVPQGSRLGLTGMFGANSGAQEAQSTVDLFRAQAEAWVKAIRGEPAEIATAEEARNVIRVIQDSYVKRRRVREIWQQSTQEVTRG